jgi:hypothetical protein
MFYKCCKFFFILFMMITLLGAVYCLMVNSWINAMICASSFITILFNFKTIRINEEIEKITK